MRWKHLFTAGNARNPMGQPKKNESGVPAASQRDGYASMNTVYRNEGPVSTASQEERQIPAGVDDAAVQEAAANLHQALESLKQATEEWNATLWEMRDVAEKNHGEIPDVNRMAEEVLAQSRKGEDEP